MKNFFDTQKRIRDRLETVALILFCLMCLSNVGTTNQPTVDYLSAIYIFISGFFMAYVFLLWQWERHKKQWQQQAEEESQEETSITFRSVEFNLGEKLEEDYENLKDALRKFGNNRNL
jgi:uncharacterized membrane protein